MKKVFILEGLDCANCAAKAERTVSKLPGVTNVAVNFITTKLTFDVETYDDALDEALKKAVNKAISNVKVVQVM